MQMWRYTELFFSPTRSHSRSRAWYFHLFFIEIYGFVFVSIFILISYLLIFLMQLGEKLLVMYQASDTSTKLRRFYNIFTFFLDMYVPPLSPSPLSHPSLPPLSLLTIIQQRWRENQHVQSGVYGTYGPHAGFGANGDHDGP